MKIAEGKRPKMYTPVHLSANITPLRNVNRQVTTRIHNIFQMCDWNEIESSALEKSLIVTFLVMCSRPMFLQRGGLFKEANPTFSRCTPTDSVFLTKNGSRLKYIVFVTMSAALNYTSFIARRCTTGRETILKSSEMDADESLLNSEVSRDWPLLKLSRTFSFKSR